MAPDSAFGSFWKHASIPQRLAIVLLGCVVLAELLAWIVFPFRGYDAYSHLFWIAEWHRLWNAGIIYPRWLPDSFVGFGAPSFYFYPPLTFFLTSALYAVLPHFSPEAIGKALGILAFVASGLTMWFYLRWRAVLRTNVRIIYAPVLGAILYMFAPYRFFDYAVRGAISEHLAFVFIPFVFWGIDRIADERSSKEQSSVAERRRPRETHRGMLMLVVALALLFLSNLPAAAVTGLGGLVYVLARARASRWRLLGTLMASAVAAVLLTAFYLLPIAALFNDVQLGRLWHPGSIVICSPFLAIFSGQALMINSYAFLSLAGVCLLLWGYARAIANTALRMKNPMVTKTFWLLAFIVFLQLPWISQFLFNHVPPFTIVQLASRFAILSMIVIAVAWQEELNTNYELRITDGPRSAPGHFASYVVLLWSIGAIGLTGLQLANIHIHRHAPLPLGEAPEYAPRWSRPYYDFGASLRAPFANDSQYVILRGGQQGIALKDVRHPYSDSIIYNSPEAGTLLLRRSYWPTWKASLEGMPTSTAPDSLGRLTIAAPAGAHRVAVWLGTENSARIGAGISVGTLILLCLLWIVI